MPTQYKLEKLTDEHRDWFVNVACVRMLSDELNKSEFINRDNLYRLSYITEHCYVVLKDDIPVGATAAMLAPNIYNPSVYELIEMFWYVLPEYRKGRAGYLLLNKLIEISNYYNVELVMTLLPKSEVSLEKVGFKMSEISYRRK